MERGMESAGESSSKLQQGTCSRLKSKLLKPRSLQCKTGHLYTDMQPVPSLEEIKIPLRHLKSLVTPEIQPFSALQFVCILLNHRQSLLCREHHITVTSCLFWNPRRSNGLQFFNGMRKAVIFEFLQVTETFPFLSSRKGRQRLWLSLKMWEQAAWTHVNNWTCWQHAQIVA